MFLNIFNSLSWHNKVVFLKLIFVAVIGAFLEVISIGAFIPFFSLILADGDPDVGNIAGFDFSNLISNSESKIVVISSILLILLWISSIFRIFSNWMQVRVVKEIALSYSTKLFRNFLIGGTPETNVPISEKLASATSKISILSGNGLKPMVTICVNLLSLLIITSFLFYINLWLTLVAALSLIIVYFLISFFTRKKISKISLEMDNAQNEVTRELKDSFSSENEIKVYGVFNFFQNRFYAQENKFRSSMANVQLLSQIPRYAAEIVLLSIIVIFIVIFDISSQGEGSSSLVSDLGAFAFALQRMMPMAQGLYGARATMKSSSDTLLQILKQSIEIKPFTVPVKITDKYSINARELSFPIINSSKPLFSDINLDIHSGVYHLTGPSGAGKSTLVNILLGLNDDYEGYVTRHLSTKKSIGYGPQDLNVLNTSVRENLYFGRKFENLEDEYIMKVITKVGLLPRVTELGGLDSFVGESGCKLSGGEKQRLVIARSILNKPDLLILDETTSGLDSLIEAKVLTELKNFLPKSIIICIAHRSLPESFVDFEIKLLDKKIEIINYR